MTGPKRTLIWKLELNRGQHLAFHLIKHLENQMLTYTNLNFKLVMKFAVQGKMCPLECITGFTDRYCYVKTFLNSQES